MKRTILIGFAVMLNSLTPFSPTVGFLFSSKTPTRSGYLLNLFARLSVLVSSIYFGF